MKIAFLNDVAYRYATGETTAVGGLERNIWILSRALAAAGWSVQVGVRQVLQLSERRVIDGVEYVGIGHGKIGQGQILSEWYQFVRTERPDWSFFAGATQLLGPLVELGKLAGVRTIFQLALDADAQPRRAAFTRSRWWPLYAWGLWRTDRIFAQHTGQLLMLHPRLRAKACILPKVAVIHSTVKSHVERASYVAWVGMLRLHKRPDLLVEIASRMPEIHFVVCGGATDYQTPSGYSTEIINQLTKLPNVDYRGRVSPDQAMEIIAGAAVLLCTSDEEGFPNTFMQAWASGTPVVTIKVDPDGIIKKHGLGVVSGSSTATEDDIRSLISLPGRRDEIAKGARRYIDEFHGQERVIGIFTKALTERGRTSA